MLSIHKLDINSAQDAANYYSRADYYLDEGADISKDKQTSRWLSKTADLLVISGAVSGADFKALLQGKLPNGEQLGIHKNGKQLHRPGYDLTFSAPKSVSIMALMGKDKRLITAHDNAVAAALAFIEQHATYTRCMVNGKVTPQATKNLIAGCFREYTSRENDPQLHTHSVVLNITQRGDGQWRSLHGDQLFQYKMAAGAVYRAELAQAAQALGYQLATTEKGFWEIDSVPTSVIKSFSKRSKTIESYSQKTEQKDAKSKAYFAQIYRPRKEKIALSELQKDWEAQSKQQAFYPEKLVIQCQDLVAQHQKTAASLTKTPDKQAANLTPINTKTAVISVENLLDLSIKKCSENQSSFTHPALIQTALQSTQSGYLSIKILTRLVEQKCADGTLVPVTDDKIKRYTTPQLIEQANQLKHNLKQSNQTVKPIMRPWFVERFIHDKQLTAAEKNIARKLLSNDTPYTAWLSCSADKHQYLFKKTARALRFRGYQVVAFSPNQSAAAWFSEQVPIKSQLLSSLVKHPLKASLTEGKQLWFIHNAERLSDQEGLAIQDKAKQAKARVVFVQGNYSLGAIRRGTALQRLLTAGLVHGDSQRTAPSVNQLEQQAQAPQKTLHQLQQLSTYTGHSAAHQLTFFN